MFQSFQNKNKIVFLTRKPFSFSDESSYSKDLSVLVKDRFIRYSFIKLSIVTLEAAHGIEVRGIILNKLNKKFRQIIQKSNKCVI